MSWINNPKKKNPSCVLGSAWDWGLFPRAVDGKKKNQSVRGVRLTIKACSLALLFYNVIQFNALLKCLFFTTVKNPVNNQSVLGRPQRCTVSLKFALAFKKKRSLHTRSWFPRRMIHFKKMFWSQWICTHRQQPSQTDKTTVILSRFVELFTDQSKWWRHINTCAICGASYQSTPPNCLTDVRKYWVKCELLERLVDLARLVLISTFACRSCCVEFAFCT